MADTDTPMFCTKCRKKVQSQGACPKGGNHHLIAISDKGVQGQGNTSGPESSKNNKPEKPRDVKRGLGKDSVLARVASRYDSIRHLAMTFVAHDSGDGQTVYHCPFCGGGNVTGRSDGTIECGFCETHFTVQVQPAFAGMPQTINGVPYDMPGMPDGVDPNTGLPPEGMDPGMDEDGALPPEGAPAEDGADLGSPEDEEAQGKNGTSVPWEHQSAYRSREQIRQEMEDYPGKDDYVRGPVRVWYPSHHRIDAGANLPFVVDCIDHKTIGRYPAEDQAVRAADAHYERSHWKENYGPHPTKEALYHSSVGDLTEDQYIAHLALIHSP